MKAGHHDDKSGASCYNIRLTLGPGPLGLHVKCTAQGIIVIMKVIETSQCQGVLKKNDVMVSIDGIQVSKLRPKASLKYLKNKLWESKTLVFERQGFTPRKEFTALSDEEEKLSKSTKKFCIDTMHNSIADCHSNGNDKKQSALGIKCRTKQIKDEIHLEMESIGKSMIAMNNKFCLANMDYRLIELHAHPGPLGLNIKPRGSLGFEVIKVRSGSQCEGQVQNGDYFVFLDGFPLYNLTKTFIVKYLADRSLFHKKIIFKRYSYSPVTDDSSIPPAACQSESWKKRSEAETSGCCCKFLSLVQENNLEEEKMRKSQHRSGGGDVLSKNICHSIAIRNGSPQTKREILETKNNARKLMKSSPCHHPHVEAISSTSTSTKNNRTNEFLLLLRTKKSSFFPATRRLKRSRSPDDNRMITKKNRKERSVFRFQKNHYEFDYIGGNHVSTTSLDSTTSNSCSNKSSRREDHPAFDLTQYTHQDLLKFKEMSRSICIDMERKEVLRLDEIAKRLFTTNSDH